MRKGANTPFPYLERRFGDAGIIGSIEELSQVEEPTIELAECAYYMGYLEEAAEMATKLSESDDQTIRLVALCLNMWVHVAMGDAATALACIQVIKRECSEELAGDALGTAPSLNVLVCARNVEDCLAFRPAWIPADLKGIGDAPLGLQAYCGYQMAYRALRQGKGEQSIGIGRSFLAVADDRYPVSCSKLRLVMASAYLQMGKPDEAVRLFDEAWEMTSAHGIIMPFVEMSAWIPGLIRHCLHGRDEASYIMLRSLVQRFRVGWHDLRDRMNASVPCGNLSILEYGVCMLAAWGWRNREIAFYLGISENTVKHNLTSVYQKTGVASRAELIELLMDTAPARFVD